MITNPCPKCQCYGSHHYTCEDATIEQVRESAVLYHKAWLGIETPHREEVKALREVIQEWRRKRDAEVTFWQGKFSIVKTENNALRKKLKLK